MPFVDDGNPYPIITQALEERYGQNGRRGLSRAQFCIFLADWAIFQAFWKIDWLLEPWCLKLSSTGSFLLGQCGLFAKE